MWSKPHHCCYSFTRNGFFTIYVFHKIFSSTTALSNLYLHKHHGTWWHTTAHGIRFFLQQRQQTFPHCPYLQPKLQGRKLPTLDIQCLLEDTAARERCSGNHFWLAVQNMMVHLLKNKLQPVNILLFYFY